jgi:hypothetical protein
VVNKKPREQTAKRPLDPAEQARRMVEQAEWAQRLADALDQESAPETGSFAQEVLLYPDLAEPA